MIKSLLTVSVAAIVISLASVAPSSNSAIAQPPDFSICDGLTGAAWGLCRGGVAAGCADGTGNPTACMSIADNFRSVTGEDPPWITPPVTCPCDYVADVPIGTEWAFVTQAVFSCPGDVAYLQAVLPLPQIPVVNAIRTTEPRPICQAVAADGSGNVREISEDELAVCRADVIDYGLAAILANPTLPVEDTCSPTLP